MVSDGLIIGAILLLAYAALHDLAARTVPNWLPLSLLAIGVLARLADHTLRNGLLVALFAFVVLFAIWITGSMGGGDVKLWAATVLLIPPHWQLQLAFFLHVLLIGGALALLYLGLWWPASQFRRKSTLAQPRLHISRLHRIYRAEIWRISRRGPLPYAFAIAASAILALLPLPLQH